MPIRSGDIRDQSQKLSEIVKNFGRFLPSQILLGVGLPEVVPILSRLHHCIMQQLSLHWSWKWSVSSLSTNKAVF